MTRTALAADPLDVGALAEFAAIVGSPLSARQHDDLERAAKRRRHVVVPDEPGDWLNVAALLAGYWLFVERHRHTVVIAPDRATSIDVWSRVGEWAQAVPALAEQTRRIYRGNGDQRIDAIEGASLIPTSRHDLAFRGVSAQRIVAVDMGIGAMPPAVWASLATTPDAQVWEVLT